MNTREAIVIALNNLGGGGQDGLINWIEDAVREDTGFGIKLLTAIVPRQSDIHVTRTTPEIRTIEALDEELRKLNLPCTRELYGIDYKGSPIDADEAEVAVAEDTAKE